ncbi:hypothetical protein QAD02_009392 [Eretmocerus hayati]|uniref:Uncharacterized protein n=1 Tax=Eretmocerus hayati TaxID=131215 RepID=A0ACC2NBM1_9HYME|nr:hypothetical protein QAD02_009392 [Eretmocerus hayati]
MNPQQLAQHQPKKRGRKKKCEMILTPEEAELAEAKKRAKTFKERKKHDRFDGMPEEEVSKRVLPDHLTNDLDIIIVSKPAIMLTNLLSSSSIHLTPKHLQNELYCTQTCIECRNTVHLS